MTIMQDSEAATIVLDILRRLSDHRDYSGDIPNPNRNTNRPEYRPDYRYEIAVDYYAFRVRIENDDTYQDKDGDLYIKYDEFLFERFGDVLRAVRLGEMVRKEWEDLTVRDLDTKVKFIKLQKTREEWWNSSKEKYARYLNSDEWKAIRNAALERAKHRCQVCNSGFKLQVHHRVYREYGKEQPEDLTVLCDRCHELYEKHGRIPKMPFA